jgi:hypothetical protein
MTTSNVADPRYERARRDAARLRGFYVHCLAYVLGNTTNFVVNWMTRHNDGDWWFQWALVAWTVALAVHGITVIGKGAWLGAAWEDRKISDYLNETQRRDEPCRGTTPSL